MRTQLIQSIRERLKTEITDRSTLKYLKTLDVEDYIDIAITVVYLYTRSKRGSKRNSIYLTEVISAIGHNIRNKYKLKRDSSVAAKTGAFILYSFESLYMIRLALGQGPKGHNTYIIQLIDDESICDLWNTMPLRSVEKLPSDFPYAAWTSSKHTTGMPLIKTQNKEVLDMVSPETHPIIFNCINKAQLVGWNINLKIYNIQKWALKERTKVFSDIWDSSSLEARATKTRETKAILSIAQRFINKTFYHLYYYDFRGRKYPATAYLHEQGSDTAKGLLLRSDKKPMGKEGYYWLMISLANNWSGESDVENVKTDKLPLQDRYNWSVNNEDEFLKYAEDPKKNTDWMNADKPWQFLAACFELMNLRIWQYENQLVNTINYPDKTTWEVYEYESNLEVYIDGSNNGSQHLTALTKDEKTAPHVNLINQKYPGDLYKYIADDVWNEISKTVNIHMSKAKVYECEMFIDDLIALKKQINAAEPQSEERKELIEKIKDFKAKNKDLLNSSSPVFWNRIKDDKERRKIVKRNVMTLPYGGTAYGLGEQQINDAKKHGIDLLLHMEYKWGAYLGREVFKGCKISLERPMQLLSVFEKAGKVAEAHGKFLSWTVPLTRFPVVQNYTEGKVKKIWVQYGPPIGERNNTGYFVNTLQLSICFLEDVKPSKGKQSQGAAPNAIHSLDAAHLAITVDRADFPVSTVHDSFGCLLADMPKLFHLIRETFVDLYLVDPLMAIMNDIDGDISNVKFGKLDIHDVLNSEYCFS